MKITIIAVGRLKEKYLKEGIEEYKKRLSRFCDLDICEVEDEMAPEGLSQAGEALVKKKEAERILKRVREGTTLIILDVQGSSISSEAFAEKLKTYFVSGSSNLTFIIGGSLGLDEGLLKLANFRMSLSSMTFPHQLARLVLMEQLFRVFKIINGETYHK